MLISTTHRRSCLTVLLLGALLPAVPAAAQTPVEPVIPLPPVALVPPVLDDFVLISPEPTDDSICNCITSVTAPLPVAIPSPATLPMLVGALIGMQLMRRRKR